METFKKNWEITKNWQLLYPIVGILSLIYSAIKLAGLFKLDNLLINALISALLFFGLLKICLLLFKPLVKRWKVNQRWKVIRIFMVFAITGSLSVIISNPIFETVGFVKENFTHVALGTFFYYVLKFILILPIYKVLLVFFGWVFREYDFFLNFALKLANRIGLGFVSKYFESK